MVTQPTLLAHSKELTKEINQRHINKQYFPDFQLHKEITAVSELNQNLLKDFRYILVAVPTQAIRSILSPLKKDLKDKMIISVSKGIEAKTLLTPIEIICSILGEDARSNIATLSGPSFAVEVMEKQPTAVTVASHKKQAAEEVQQIFHAPYFRVYLSDDPIGVEIAGALKNVIAIAAGACTGLGFKANSAAALITRGLAELTRIGVAFGAQSLTFKGLSGVGDLMLTCSSHKSRNFRVGYLIAQGKTLDEACDALGSVAEGVVTTKTAYLLAQKHKIRTSIIKAVYEVLYEDLNLSTALEQLLTGSARHEHE